MAGGIRGLLAVACVSVAAMAARATTAAEAAAPETVAKPGAVVRWAGDAIAFCGRGGETWPPLAGSCWFPIDLLEPEGAVVVHRSVGGAREEASIRVSEYPYPVQRLTIEDSSKVELSSENLARVRSEQARVRPLWSLAGPALFELPLSAPLADLGQAGSFGSRRFFNDQPRSPHSGADYPAAEGTPVYSIAPGRVVLTGDLFFSGNSVFIDHGDGLISMYFHLSSLLVEGGQEVARRDPIGAVGQTGRTTGPHLHMGIRWKGARVDPSLLLGPPSAVPELPIR